MSTTLLSRRTWLQRVGSATALGPFAGLVAAQPAAVRSGDYGPLLQSQPDMKLPEGFRYVKGGAALSPLRDGSRTPPAHDGMGVFRIGRQLHLVRNHELDPEDFRAVPPLNVGALAYDRLGNGGCTILQFDPRAGRFGASWAALGGTIVNCGGGPTPWGTWLSCEETTAGLAAGLEQPHGYVFEVDPSVRQPQAAVPLKAMGRFLHEAAAVDATTGVVYLTEDNGEPFDGFYRFVPRRPGVLAAGGVLQMLAVTGAPRYSTLTGQTPDLALPVHWVTIADPDPANAEADPSAVFNQGYEAGGAAFLGGEGVTMLGRDVYLMCSGGGDAELGQVWRYSPVSGQRGWLTLVFESADPAVLDEGDNLCTSPRGTGLLIAEDGDGEDIDGGTNGLRGLTLDGYAFPFAENTTPLPLAPFGEVGVGRSEYAGVQFSPEGQWLFCNLQYPGCTYAITGPWSRGCL